MNPAHHPRGITKPPATERCLTGPPAGCPSNRWHTFFTQQNGHPGQRFNAGRDEDCLAKARLKQDAIARRGPRAANHSPPHIC